MSRGDFLELCQPDRLKRHRNSADFFGRTAPLLSLVLPTPSEAEAGGICNSAVLLNNLRRLSSEHSQPDRLSALAIATRAVQSTTPPLRSLRPPFAPFPV